MPTSNQDQRGVDALIQGSQQKVKRMSLLSDRQVKLWKVMLVALFFAGAGASGGLLIKSNLQQDTAASTGGYVQPPIVDTSSWQQVYSNTFENPGSVQQWKIFGDKGAWEVKNAALLSPLSKKDHGIVGLDIPVLTEFDAIYSVMFSKKYKDAESGFLFGVKPDMGGYVLKLDPDDKRWRVMTINAKGKTGRTIGQGKVNLAVGVLNHVRVIRYGNALAFAVSSGNSQPSFGAQSRFFVPITMDTEGAFGFYAEGGQITFDSLVINKPHSVPAGSLGVSVVSGAPVNVIAGSTAVPLLSITFDAAQSQSDISVTQLELSHHASAAGIHHLMNNLTLFDGSTQVSIPRSGEPDTQYLDATTTIPLIAPLTIAKGQTKQLVLKGDFALSSPSGQSHTFGLTSSASVFATSVPSNTFVTPSVVAGYGAVFNVAAAGSLTVTNAQSNPASGLLSAFNAPAPFHVINLKAEGEDVQVKSITIEFQFLNGQQYFTGYDLFSLYDGTAKLAEHPSVVNKLVFDIDNLVIPAGQSKDLTYKLDVSGPIYGKPSGVTFTSKVVSYDLKGMTSGSSAVMKYGNPVSNAMTIVKSVPVVTKGSVSGTLQNGAAVPLARFSVAASAGDVGFYLPSFEITTTTAVVTNFKLFEDPDGVGRDLTMDGGRKITEVLSNGAYGLTILLDSDASGVSNGGEYVVIPVGTTKTFELRGDVTGTVAGSMVKVDLRSDSGFSSTYPNCAGGATTGNNTCFGIYQDTMNRFIWTDFGLGTNNPPFNNATSTATNTAEWFNGYQVFNPMTLQVLTK